MKKTMVLFAFTLSLISIRASAQNGHDGGRREMMKQKLKDSLHLTDARADSVLVIQQEFQPRMREIMRDRSLDQNTRAAQLAPVTGERRTKLKSVLTDDEITKLEAMEQRMRAEMRQRMNGDSSGNK